VCSASCLFYLSAGLFESGAAHGSSPAFTSGLDAGTVSWRRERYTMTVLPCFWMSGGDLLVHPLGRRILRFSLGRSSPRPYLPGQKTPMPN